MKCSRGGAAAAAAAAAAAGAACRKGDGQRPRGGGWTAALSSWPTPPRPRSRPHAPRPRRCPYCERVWLALEEKGIDYDAVLIDLYAKPDW
jgi:glutathione S-transferase